MRTKVGEVTHWFSDIEVAAIKLQDDLAVGDVITFTRHGEDLFRQVITSMEIDHQQIDMATTGDEIAIEADERVREGVSVYKED